MKNRPLQIGDALIQPGERVTLGLPTPELYTYASLHIPIHIVHGKKAGPVLLVSAALHGDEMNGAAIIHNLLESKALSKLQGTLIMVPVVNVYGLMTLSRNLPDRRDLDGSFPGKEGGSFAARLAHYFNTEILSKITHCIDIHSAAPHQRSFPQIQANLELPETKSLADAFQAPVTIHTESERGLLWQDVPTLIFDAGEPLRLDEECIRVGSRGILDVMRNLDMLSSKRSGGQETLHVHSTAWLRSPGSGLCQLFKKLGSAVKKGDKLAQIYDPFGTSQEFSLIAPCNGMIIAKNTLPLVNEGDTILKIAHS